MFFGKCTEIESLLNALVGHQFALAHRCWLDNCCFNIQIGAEHIRTKYVLKHLWATTCAGDPRLYSVWCMCLLGLTPLAQIYVKIKPKLYVSVATQLRMYANICTSTMCACIMHQTHAIWPRFYNQLIERHCTDLFCRTVNKIQ